MARILHLNTPRQRAIKIFEVLRERICLLDYRPGEIIKERELAEEFGVSRTPLRRVMNWLESDGLINSRQGHGTVVTEIDLESLKDIYFLRIKLAEMIGQSRPLAPTPAVMEGFRELREKCDSAKRAAPDYRLFAEINIGLHKQFQAVIRNRPLHEISDRLFYQTSRMWFRLLRNDDWIGEVEEMEREIVSVERYFTLGDVESAGYVRRNHLSTVVRRVESMSGSGSENVN
jgi:DNA-binding GntR family transcriptional regulator